MRAHVTSLFPILLLIATCATLVQAQPPVIAPKVHSDATPVQAHVPAHAHEIVEVEQAHEKVGAMHRVDEATAAQTGEKTEGKTDKKSGDERSDALGGHQPPRSTAIPDDALPIVHFFYWLGNFHPPLASFPIALFVAAGLAELLLMFDTEPTLEMFGATPPFESISRYCLWFAVLTGAATGLLGWLFAGFDITDRPELLQTHYWLGSAAVIWAIVTLIIGEFRYRSDHRGLRAFFRLALLVAVALVLATGYYGGAMIYGLDHYKWKEQITVEPPVKRIPDVGVKITRDMTFEPRRVTITVGETVIWANHGIKVHTVTADKELADSPEHVELPVGAKPFHSGNLVPGEVYKHRFTVPGRYKYFCTRHEAKGMIGEIIVRPKEQDGVQAGESY